jgi:hypothetical protein
MEWNPSKYDDNNENEAQQFQPIQINSLETGHEYDCEAFFSMLEAMDLSDNENEAVEDEFFDFDSDENGNASILDGPFSGIPNLLATVACFTRTIDAKLTHVEHKYGKTIEQLWPYFAWASTESIKATLNASTQFYRATQWMKKIKQHIKSRFPGANVERINETVCTDTAFMEDKGRADGITGHGGSIGFQLFVGKDSKHIAVYPVQTDGDYPKILGDYICMHGAPKKIFSDNTKAKTSAKARDIYHNFGISDGSSEPHYQNQNAAEQEIQDIKKDVEMILNITNTPYEWWPLCVEYIALVKNHTARSTLDNRTPIEKRTGKTPDVSKLLQYRWWEPVYFLDDEGLETLGRQNMLVMSLHSSLCQMIPAMHCSIQICGLQLIPMHPTSALKPTMQTKCDLLKTRIWGAQVFFRQ